MATSGLFMPLWLPFLLFLRPISALASLYPTKPVSTTFYTAGQAAELRWVEDGQRPLLSATGLMKIDLYAGNNTYLATIANDIDPLALGTIVYIPQIIPKNYHLCTLRFITAHPPQVIYTADFNIIPSPYLEDPRTSTTTTTSSSSVLPTTDSTILSRISSTQPALPNPSDNPSSKSTSASLTWSLSGRVGIQGSNLVDVERIKFRLLFIVWPALVGLSLAI